MKYIYFFLILLTGFQSIGQNILLQEFFEYDAGVPISQHGWTAHSGIDNNPIKTAESSLTFKGYIGENIGRAALVVNNGSDENKPFTTTVSQPGEGEATINTYVSFLVKPSDVIPQIMGTTRPYFLHLGEYMDVENPDFSKLSSEFRGRVFIFPGSTEGTFRLNLSFLENEPPADNLTKDLDASKAYLVVLKYSSIAGPNNDEVSLYLFAEGDDFNVEPSKPTIGPLTGARRDIALQAVCLRQYMEGQNVIVDGILVRDSWNLSKATSTKDNNLIVSEIKVYPNPALNTDIITFDSDLEFPIKSSISDLNGRLICEQALYTNSINISNLPSGVYILSTQSGNKQATEKIVIFN